MTLIDDYIASLGRHGWLTLAGLNEPMERADLERTVSEFYPALAAAIDPTIERWWRWAGSIDSTAITEALQGREGIVVPFMVAPDGAELGVLEHLLTMLSERPGLVREGEQVFPILRSVHSCVYALRRANSGQPWRIWYLDREDSDWRPIQRVFFTPSEAADWRASGGVFDIETPTFDEWLTRIIEGLDSGEFEISNRGGVELTDRPADLEDLRYRYPWR